MVAANRPVAAKLLISQKKSFQSKVQNFSHLGCPSWNVSDVENWWWKCKNVLRDGCEICPGRCDVISGRISACDTAKWRQGQGLAGYAKKNRVSHIGFWPDGRKTRFSPPIFNVWRVFDWDVVGGWNFGTTCPIEWANFALKWFFLRNQ